MAYRVAGIDVHKRMLAVVVADVAVETEYVFERRLVGTTPDQLRTLAAWFIECEVEEVVMESTAQYWRPVWDALEGRLAISPASATRRGTDGWRAASGASAVEPWAARPEERLSGCGTTRETPGRARADSQLRARFDTASLADGHSAQIPTDV